MKISFVEEEDKFKAHLQKKDNDRIIFSGPYGIGKTTFLKEYFRKNEKYEVFHLYPANYSIATNSDIFEYIKYDILYQIVNKVEIESESFTKSLSSQSYLLDKGQKFFLSFLEGIASLNPKSTAIFKVGPALEKLVDDYKDYQKNLEEADIKLIDNFRAEIENRLGSLYEKNQITDLIQYYIEKIKDVNADNEITGKLPVLIIDDLDRIDPEHFFRVLNIFSAHIDQNFDDPQFKNKFGFYQIIFVFDIQNARNIFHYRYGNKVDFNGYIDKFYSRAVYAFLPNSAILDSLQDILKKIIIREKDQSNLNLGDLGLVITSMIYHLLNTFLRKRRINLRNILKLIDKEYPIPKRKIPKSGTHQNLYNVNFHLLIVFDFMIELFGEADSFEVALENISLKKDYDVEIIDKHNFLKHLIPLLYIEEHKLISKQEFYQTEIQSINLNYHILNNTRTFVALIFDEKGRELSINENAHILESIEINKLIHMTFMKCKEIGIY